MTKISYSGYRFPPEIIPFDLALSRFILTFRDFEDLAGAGHRIERICMRQRGGLIDAGGKLNVGS
jgi:hypothetical protein